MARQLSCVLIFMLLMAFANADSNGAIIKQYEGFFKEAFSQPRDSAKIVIDSAIVDSIGRLEYIDFCSYPPDRSLPFGALDNGRFKGEKIADLPFACDISSGARKYFISNSDIESSYVLMAKVVPFLADKNMESKITKFWQLDSNKRLWVLYRDNVIGGAANIIFSQRGGDVEVILQYINLPLF